MTVLTEPNGSLSMNMLMTTDFMPTGAWVYAYSRPVMEAKISERAKIIYSTSTRVSALRQGKNQTYDKKEL